MSKYTTQVRFIVEASAGMSESDGFNSIDEIISKAVPEIFNFDFPIFDEAYRHPLCAKILKHYYTREICAETVGLWKLWLCNRLNEIMPYYNQLYRSELMEFNPLYDIDYSREYKRHGDGTRDVDSTSEGNAESVSRQMFSDTPQGALDNIENEAYLTNATKNTNKGTSKNTYKEGNVMQNTEDYLERVKGKTAGKSYSKLIQEYRETFLNIDAQVINNLSDLFFGLW